MLTIKQKHWEVGRAKDLSAPLYEGEQTNEYTSIKSYFIIYYYSPKCFGRVCEHHQCVILNTNFLNIHTVTTL